MGKMKKKRNKPYTGVNAAIKQPIVTKISAANRSKFGQWWFDNKRIAKPVLKISGVVVFIVIVIIEIIQIAQ